ncbi:Terpene synthase, metal-binding domain-containing protein [Artemisia annua]|uniref:Terpene synthase, metal-binding domain-containing protein n=1 Tax=Artemisia annua TaxID=35608 RepID=A0A2U1LNX9_ARTAN|nr:Terpene synthase, metal-binding domain-containing protein [Artemisia annua]
MVRKRVVRSLLVETKWLKDGYVPTLKEFMPISLITCVYPLVVANSYVGQGDDNVTEDPFKWVSSHPPFVRVAASIYTLMDDIVSRYTFRWNKKEAMLLQASSATKPKLVHQKEEAVEYFSKQVEDAWKVISQESLRPTGVPFPLVMPAINLARVGKDVINCIKSLFVHPMVVLSPN